MNARSECECARPRHPHLPKYQTCKRALFLQALEALPDQLALSVMRAVTHLPALFAALPPRLHPAALRAHHPSIDSHHSLLLTYPTIGTLHHTMHALSDLGNLTAITLRMRPHGSGNPEDMLPQEFLDHALRLPHLEDVCMEDWRLLRPPLVAASRAEPLATAAAAATAPLTRLALRNSTVSMQALAPRFSTLRTLRMLEVAAASRHDTSGQRCRMVPDDVVALARHISELTALEDLSLEQNNVVPEDWSWIAVALATLTRLRAVNVAGLQIPADVMFCVHDAEGSPPVDSDSAVVSPVWQGIESLNISGNLVCTRKPWLWRALAEMPRLTRLSVADVPMERGVFVNLAEALQAGRAARKDCSESGTAGGEGSMHLGGGGKGPAPFPLVSLDVSGCRIVWGSAFETCMREWSGLQRLVASGTGRLQRMGVPGQGLTAGRAPQAARGLVHVPHLQELVLSDHTGLGAQGLKALAPALGGLTALTVLDISRCHVGADGAAALCPELARLGRLEVLKLAANKVGSRGAGELLAAVVACTRLREVDLARNEVGDGVAVVVKAQLALLQALERLDLRGNNFREAKAALRALSIRRGNVMVL